MQPRHSQGAVFLDCSGPQFNGCRARSLFKDSPYVVCSGICGSGYLQAKVLDKLSSIGTNLTTWVNVLGTWMSSAEMHIIHQYKAQGGKCGNDYRATTPGTSIFEGGFVFELVDYGWWKTRLVQHGFVHTQISPQMASFESGTEQEVSRFAKMNLMAFQKLWNRHNPNATIAEDGIYGPETINAFNQSPCDGF
ncbi:hypothetical protein FGO68_gene16963 [Halteria grandinella]|uniref:Uncharacterized protein n=1 Tax=Halteria grandinella TaxID=5974 RepID=A0A8J8NL39_HALGN|nr:hypothetical protein FGO68_gene16963 [Halteria grandinella]